MFLSLYRIRVKTRRWYLKIFWHCVDIAKVNAWLLYRRHCTILKVPKRKEMSLLKFSCEEAEGLIFQNKVVLWLHLEGLLKGNVWKLRPQPSLVESPLFHFQVRVTSLINWGIGLSPNQNEDGVGIAKMDIHRYTVASVRFVCA